jgi:hypothetical protein
VTASGWLSYACIPIALIACSPGAPATTGTDLARCLSSYHAATPEAGSNANLTRGVTYAVPCKGLSPAGDLSWSLLVVAHDDSTIRAYFLGGLVAERCDLLRAVTIQELASSVTVRLEAGADPKLNSHSACSAVGQNYVTQISLGKPLGGRSLAGPNDNGQVQHL